MVVTTGAIVVVVVVVVVVTEAVAVCAHLADGARREVRMMTWSLHTQANTTLHSQANASCGLSGPVEQLQFAA